MQRLITFGCSMTYGHGLPDCHIEPNFPGPVPSKLAWPSLVANQANVQLSNQGKCGASNLEILYNILKYKFSEGDVVIVMWSFVGRDLIFGKKGLLGKQQLISVGFWQTTELANNWNAVHSDADIATKTWLYVHHATLFLKSKNIPVYNVFANYKSVKRYKPKFLNLDYHKLKFKSWAPFDFALDNLHPGVKTHKLIADEITEILNGNN
jgi:hypothetical protein